MKPRFLGSLFLAVLLVAAQLAYVVPAAEAVISTRVTLNNLEKACGGGISSAYTITNLGSAPATTVHDFYDSNNNLVYVLVLPSVIPVGGQVQVSLETLPIPCGTYTVVVSADQPIEGALVQAYSIDGLVALINSLPPEALAPQLITSLVQKVNAARNQATRENMCAAVNILGAFQNEVEAQRGNGIADATATQLIDYSGHIIAQLLASLPSGEAC